MVNESANYYGALLLVLMFVTWIGIFTTEPQTTGFAVKKDKCFEGTDFGECSSVKPKYCDNGALKNDCQRCGCREEEVCQADGNCLPKCADDTLFGYCSENKPFLCSKGTLLENCFKCGCFPGQTCLNNGACSGDIEVGAGAEEKITEEIELEEEKEVEEEPEIEIIKEEPKPGFWWNLFCKVFYFNEYDDCIADAIRHKNK
jgi:hypothetical protein